MSLTEPHREYTASHWPNKGIKGHELQAIYGKIVASDRTLAGETSPDNDTNKIEAKSNGAMHASDIHD